MPSPVLPIALILFSAWTWSADADPTAPPDAAAQGPVAPTGPLDFTLKANDGTDHPLGQYRGKVVMIVNTASKCGLTPQYAALQKLSVDHQDRGLVVIGVPANDFNKQEPGSDGQIRQFCTDRFQVTFPLMAKVSVKGEGIAPLYDWLTTKSAKPGPIGWNFAKFLIGRDGAVIDRFESKTRPDDPKVLAAVERALASPAPSPAVPAGEAGPIR